MSSIQRVAAQSESTINPANPEVKGALDGVFNAFKTHKIVAIGDQHGLTQEIDFYIDLVRDPRFARGVNNIVVEFGDAARQETLDHYINGEDVAYEELRKVWSDTVGWSPAVTSLAYVQFFAQVRAVNATLSPNERIHIWLGDPPIDWSMTKTRSDVKAQSQRNSYPAELIRKNILAKNLKALVIYGTFHLYGKNSVRGLAEAEFPHSFFVITPYSGYPDKSCSLRLEGNFSAWPVPALATAIRGTGLEPQLSAPDCKFREGAVVFWPPEVTEAEKIKSMAAWEEESSGVAGDALLYLGPAATLTDSAEIPDLYLDFAYRKEMDRRSQIMSGAPMHITAPSKTSPSYVHPSAGATNKQ